MSEETTPARILIVEDESITAEDLRDILTEIGYTIVAVVANGPDAIAEAEHGKPDLALMDIRIQGPMDGSETARVLRERFNIPVIYLTAHADRATVGRAKLAEPLGYITKPFKESELEAAIEIALHKHRSDLATRAREEILSSTVRSISRGVVSINRSGAVTLLNPAAESWTGWSANEALGKPVTEILPMLLAGEPCEPELDPVLAHGHLGELPPGAVFINPDGGTRPIEGTIAPVRDHTGVISGAVIVFGEPGAERPQSPVQAEAAEEPALEFGKVRLVAVSPVMKQVLRFARRVAESEANTVLLEGESGTGKDVMANFMHYVGKRQDRPFVPLNCAAIPENLLESELFGYEKGAFTDARAAKPGILEVASGGTVFLDEIGEMPILLQAKMLRVLEEQTFRRLGGVRDVHVDLRIVAASNRNLSESVEKGQFRLDLYYRLNVIQIVLPPLREHRDDILPLARHFIRHYAQRFNRDIQGLTPAASTAMLEYEWPGNIRELRNTVERAVLLEETKWIQVDGLRIPTDQAPYGRIEDPIPAAVEVRSGATLEETEKAMVIEALAKSNGNQTKAAAMLGITRDTLRYRLKKFNLQRQAGFTEAGSGE